MVLPMTENSMNFAKDRLKDSDLIPQIRSVTKKKICIQLTFSVKHYSKLKKNVIYYASAKMDKYSWICKLVIANGTLFVFMFTDIKMKNPDVTLCKASGNIVVNNDITCLEYLIVSKFCQIAIMNPINEYLHSDSLIIEFNYEFKEPENYYCSLKYARDSEAYYKAFKFLYVIPPDVKMQVGGKVFRCNKAVLSEHSKYFARFFKNNQPSSNKRTCVAVNEDPGIFNLVIVYMYSGELRCDNEGDMIEVYRIANTLQIFLLEEACMEYFEVNLSPSNAKRILGKAVLYELLELKNAAVRYMIRNNLITFSQISKQPGKI